MLTIGGMLLGAVLTAPGAAGGAAPADPFDPSVPQVAIARSDVALGLRDPFAHDTRTITTRRVPRPSDVHADLLDPFAARSSDPAPRTSPSVTASAGSGADLRSPFDHAASRRAQPPAATSSIATARPDQPPHAELRDPFGR